MRIVENRKMYSIIADNWMEAVQVRDKLRLYFIAYEQVGDIVVPSGYEAKKPALTLFNIPCLSSDHVDFKYAFGKTHRFTNTTKRVKKAIKWIEDWLR